VGSTVEPDLGPFAPEQGARNRLAVAAAGVAGTAIVAALVRPVADASGTSWGVRWAGSAALALATAAALASLMALYQVAAGGQRGRELALTALGVGAAAALTAYLYGATRDGTLQLGSFFERYFDREILRAIRRDLARGALNTIKAALLSEALAIPAGLLVATFALSPRRWARYPAVAYVDLVRGLPLLVLTSLVYFGLVFIGVSLAPFTAIVVTLTVNASAYVAEIFRAGIQSVARGQMDAARGLGMSHSTAMLTIVIPQAVRAVIPPLVSEFIALVKDTAVVFVIVGFTVQSADLFGVARTAAASTFSPTPYMAAAIGYLILTVPLARLVGRMEGRLRAGLT
jgi:polar amino acid transport system permease protein